MGTPLTDSTARGTDSRGLGDGPIVRELVRLLRARIPVAMASEERKQRIRERARKLELLFEAMGPEQADLIVERLEDPADPLSELFHGRLHPATVQRLLDIGRRRAALGTRESPSALAGSRTALRAIPRLMQRAGVVGAATLTRPPQKLSYLRELRDKRAIADSLLRTAVRLANLRGAYVGKDLSRRTQFRFLLGHIEYGAQLLRASDDGKSMDRARLTAAVVASDLAGLAYDFMRIEVEAKRLALRGVLGSRAQDGLQLLFDGMNLLQDDHLWVRRKPDQVRDVMYAEDIRDNLLSALPVANVARTGVVAASITSGAFSLAELTGHLAPAGLAALSRVIDKLRGSKIQIAWFEVAGAGRFPVGINVVIPQGAILALTAAEIRALIQAGVLARALPALQAMASGVALPQAGAILSEAFDEWAAGLPKQSASGDGAPKAYQRRVAGDTEFHAKDGDEEVWADGVDPGEEFLLEAKFVGKPKDSPFLAESRVPNKIRGYVLDELDDQFRRYAAVIRDPSTPAKGLRVITNDARAVSYFEELMRRHKVPGRVVVQE